MAKIDVKKEWQDLNTLVETKKELTYEDLLNRLQELEWLVKNTTDTNKIKDYERQKEVLNNFAFSILLYPKEDKNWDEINCPIISYRTKKNYVAEEGKKVEQTTEITYLQDWQEKKQVIEMVEFARSLKRTNKMQAIKILNLDWSNVHISKRINPDSKTDFYLMEPTSNTFKVIFDYNWQEIEILSTYLNA